METMFLGEVNVDLESMYSTNEEFRVLTERYDVSLDDLRMVNKSIKNENLKIVLTESERNDNEYKLERLREEINRYKSKAVEKGDLAKVFAWWGLGLYLVGLLTMSAPGLALLFFILSIMFSVMSIVNSQEAIKYSKKLLATRSELKALKRRTKDKKLIDRIDDLLDRIEENHESLGYDIRGNN